MMASMIRASIKNGIGQLFPAYFAFVMSTGIVSIASHLLHYQMISNLLFIVNNIAYAVLFVLYFLRLVCFFPSFTADLTDHSKGAGFLTIVAASCILGVQYILLKQNFFIPILLWFFSIVVWVVLVYSYLTGIAVKKSKPSLEEGMNGGWLLLVVSTQSLSILGTQLASHLPIDKIILFFSVLCFYLLGFLLYIIFITLIIYRLLFFTLKAEEFTPTYWIDTGAAAISALAGATLVKNINGVMPFQSFVPAISMVNVLAWASATWWIPIVLILELWRHKQIALRYKASYWSMVFPLGMYTVATWNLSASVQLPFLEIICHGFIYVTWFAWLVSFAGMCFSWKDLFVSNK